MTPNAIYEFRGAYGFLSNFHRCSVLLDNVRYSSVEHAYQAAKSMNAVERREIWSAASPREAKRLGKTLRARPDWERKKLVVMLDLLRQKFTVGGGFAHQLDATGDAELIEGNEWGDVFWGVCRGSGLNWLGRLLMHVRAENRAGRQLPITL